MSEQRKKRQSCVLRSRQNGTEGENQERLLQKINRHDRGKMNHPSTKITLSRQGSYDQVQKIIREEGRTARNLIAWNVPFDCNGHSRAKSSRAKGAKSLGRKPARSMSASVIKTRKDAGGDTAGIDSAASSGLTQSTRCTPKKVDMRARYWAFLFDNLRRAVDAIYETCESDESVIECKEAIMMLEQSTNDFKSLIQRVKLLKVYETAEEGHKPTSLAWEVRKSSPGKTLLGGGNKEHFPTNSPASRNLNFNSVTSSSGLSWADKVRGGPMTNSQEFDMVDDDVITLKEPCRVNNICAEEDTAAPLEGEDLEGWETVHRGGRIKCRSNSMKLHTPHSQTSSPSNHDTTEDPPVAALCHSSETAQSPVLSSSTRVRSRAGSLDSEKENQPRTEYESNQLNIYIDGVEKLKEPALKDIYDDETKQITAVISLSLEQSPPGPAPELGGAEESNHQMDSEQEEEEDDDDDKLAIELETMMEEEDSLTHQLEQEQEQALESAMAEEKVYLEAIACEENMEIDDLTTGDDEDETDKTDTESELTKSGSTTGESLSTRRCDWDKMVEDYDANAEYREKTCWGDMVEDVDSGRTPGRVVHIHEKLSSPSRKRSPTENHKRHEARQAKARAMREKLLQEKAERLRLLTNKVAEVRAFKEELLRQQREMIKQKLHRAESKRHLQLKMKIRKAHEEETKANEIAFINSLEAQNKRHEIMSKHQESEARLQDIQDERQRRHEEKAAKEVAVELRRKALQAERLARLNEMQERRRQRESEFEARQQEREKERVETARAREREHEERIAALNAQQQAHIEELQKKIQLKQDESDRRHREKLERIREKAFVMSILLHSTEDHNEALELAPYEQKKLCVVCNVMIPSEVYLQGHLRGKKHQQALMESNGGRGLSKAEIEMFNLEHISDAPNNKPDLEVILSRERHKALKKRCKKLRQRMVFRGAEYENSVCAKQQTVESQHRAKLQKLVKDLTKYLQTDDRGPWPQNKVSALDRAVGEIGRIMEKKAPNEQNAFRTNGGLTILNKIMLVIGQSTASLPLVIPHKSLVLVCNILRLTVKGCYDNCHYMLFTNKIGYLVDQLIHQLNLVLTNEALKPSSSSTRASNSAMSVTGGSTSSTTTFAVATPSKLSYDLLASSLMHLIATILSCLSKKNPSANSSEASAVRMSASGTAFMSRVNDIVSYIISVGLVDKLAWYFNGVHGPIDCDQPVGEFIQHAMGLLSSMIKIASQGHNNDVFDKKPDDPTQLIATFRATDLVGIISFLYGILLHSGTPTKGDNTPPPELSTQTLTVTVMGFKMFNHLAVLSLELMQSALGEEAMSLEFRHITSYLLWCCCHHANEELLHEVILSIGYFSVLHRDNQMLTQSGQPPTILQQLCALPFQYFSNSRLTNILFPTLIACCYDNQLNREILEQELSCLLLSNFIEEKSLEIQSKLLATTPKKGKTQDKDPDGRMSFTCRFPPDSWTPAQNYFQTN